MERAYQGHPGKDEDQPHDDRAENTPEQDLVLVDGGDGEIGEDQEKNEEVVYAERLLNQIPGQELERGLGAAPEVDPQAYQQGQDDPEGSPEQRFLDADNMSFALEDLQVQDQHDDDENNEASYDRDFARYRYFVHALFVTGPQREEPCTASDRFTGNGVSHLETASKPWVGRSIRSKLPWS